MKLRLLHVTSHSVVAAIWHDKLNDAPLPTEPIPAEVCHPESAFANFLDPVKVGESGPAFA